MSVNRVMLMGRIANPNGPELRYLQDGKPVANFRLAVDRQYKNKDGSRDVDFFPVTVYGKIAEVLAKNTDKGCRVIVEGRLQNRSYKDKEGRTQWITEVIAANIQIIDWAKEADNTVGEDGSEEMQEDDLPF